MLPSDWVFFSLPSDFDRVSIQCLFFCCVRERNSALGSKKQKLITAVFYDDVIDRVGKRYFVLLIDFEACCEAFAILEDSNLHACLNAMLIIKFQRKYKQSVECGNIMLANII